MDPFRLCLALGPVAIYLLLLGALNLARRPFLVSGTRDAAALGLAASGFVMVGPIELFFPEALAVKIGPWVWLILLGCYFPCLVVVLLLLRPRLIIHNISVDQLRPLLADLVQRLDTEARWAGDSLNLPGLGVQLHVDGVPAMRNVSLVSSGPQQSHTGWRHLETALCKTLQQVEVVRNPRGASLLGAGALIGLLLVYAIALNPHGVAQSLIDMLRL